MGLERAIRWTLLVVVGIALAATTAAHDELDQAGTPHAWTGEAERIRVIDFAAAWCRPCWTALPRLQRLADRHPELEVIVVSVDDDVAGRDRLVDRLELRLPVLWDEHHHIAEHYRPTGMPATFVLDRDGTVVAASTGSGDREWTALVAEVEALLAR